MAKHTTTPAGDGGRSSGREAAASWWRRRPVLLVLAGSALGLVLLACGALELHEWRATRRTDAALRDLRERGLGVRDAALAGRRPEDDGVEELREAFEPLDGLPQAVRRASGSPPERVATAFDDPDDPEARLVFTPDPSDPACPADVEGALGLIDERLARVEEHVDAGLAREVAFPLGYAARTQAHGGRASHLKGLVSAFEVRAGYAMHEGRPDEAWADVERILGLARAAPNASLSARLLHDALARGGVETLEQLLRLGPPPGPARRERLVGALAALDEREGFTLCLRGELNLFLHSVPRDDPTVWVEDDEDRLPDLLLEPYLQSQRAGYVETVAEVIRASTLPPPDALAALEEIEAAVHGDGRELVVLLLPKVRKTYEKLLDTQARLRMAQVALEATASPALPREIADAPRDPWSLDGAPLRYARHEAGAATLWSVGADRVDDGGVAPDTREGEGPGSPETDLVLRLAPPAGG